MLTIAHDKVDVSYHKNYIKISYFIEFIMTLTA